VRGFQLPRPPVVEHVETKVGAIDVHDIQGFSHINKIYGTFLDWIHGFKSFTGLFSEFTKPVIR
jgi:hypothetical protein